MGDLSKNFSRFEFACQDGDCPHCGGCSPVDSRLVDSLQLFRDMIGKSLHVNSGFRCLIWNRTPVRQGGPGSHDGSQHTRGTAADIALAEGMTAEDMKAVAERIGAFQYGGIGLYDTFIHLDVRTDGPPRWDNRVQHK